MKKGKKIVLWTVVAGLVSVLLLIVVCHFAVVWNAAGRTFDNVAEVPRNKVGLLLATSPVTAEGRLNYHFRNRIKAADELYKSGKVDYIIASGGDYRQTHKYGCNEPQAILDSLVARGIPSDRIILDYEGVRTLNSIAKAREVYGLDSMTLISQKYHNERAIYLADNYDIYKVGYNAEPTPLFFNRLKNTMREYLARVKMFMDLMFGSRGQCTKSS